MTQVKARSDNYLLATVDKIPKIALNGDVCISHDMPLMHRRSGLTASIPDVLPFHEMLHCHKMRLLPGLRRMSYEKHI